MKKSKGVYINAKQQELLEAKQRDRTWVGGRGTGKSRCIGYDTVLKCTYLPRSRGFLSSTTYGQIFTKIFPPIESAWNAMGYKEHTGPSDPGHYVIGKLPPREWAKPYSQPRRYENIITFWNGFTVEMLSMDRPDLARGGSFDWGEIDECFLVDKEHIDKVLLPTIRGNKHHYLHWSHQQLTKYSSMPYTSKGRYLLDYEIKAKEDTKTYFYIESTAYDNIHVLGQDGIDHLKKELGPLIFDIEIMNKRSGKTSFAFYHAFDDDKHCYLPGYIYGEGSRGIVTQGTNERDRTRIIDSSWDFSGWFKCCTVWQEKNRTEYLIDNFHRKEDDSIDKVVDDLCAAYADQAFKHIRIWGEPLGHNRETVGGTIYERLKDRFRKNGWHAEIKAPSAKSANHEVRYEFINEIFAETNHRYPRIRINVNAKPVVISLNSAEVDKYGKKNKSDEKNKSFPQEFATHYTDTVDYYFMQKYGPTYSGLILPGHGVGRVM